MVERVEELHPELQVDSFLKRQMPAFAHSQVHILRWRSGAGANSGIRNAWYGSNGRSSASNGGGSLDKGQRIEPCQTVLAAIEVAGLAKDAVGAFQARIAGTGY